MKKMLTIKLIFHNKLRQETLVIFSSKMNDNKREMIAQITSLCLTSSFFNGNKRKQNI